MEALRIEYRGVHELTDRLPTNISRLHEEETEKKQLNDCIPFRLEATNHTKRIDKYLRIVKYLVAHSQLDCDSKRDIVQVSNVVNGKVAAAFATAAAVAFVDQGAAGANTHRNNAPGTYINVDPGFEGHVNNLRGTMFYVCQGSCLCGTVNNRGKVIYCYGDLVPRQGELFGDGAEGSGSTTSKDLLAAQLGIWTFGIFALLIVLILIRKSITSLRKHLQQVTQRLPLYHDDDSSSLSPSATSPSSTAKSVPGDKPPGATDSMVGQQPNNVPHIPILLPSIIKLPAPSVEPQPQASAPPLPPLPVPPQPQAFIPPPPSFLPPPKQQTPQAEPERKPGNDKINVNLPVPIDIPDGGGSKPVTTEPEPMKPNMPIIPVTRL